MQGKMAQQGTYRVHRLFAILKDIEHILLCAQMTQDSTCHAEWTPSEDELLHDLVERSGWADGELIAAEHAESQR